MPAAGSAAPNRLGQGTRTSRASPSKARRLSQCAVHVQANLPVFATVIGLLLVAGALCVHALALREYPDIAHDLSIARPSVDPPRRLEPITELSRPISCVEGIASSLSSLTGQWPRLAFDIPVTGQRRERRARSRVGSCMCRTLIRDVQRPPLPKRSSCCERRRPRSALELTDVPNAI